VDIEPTARSIAAHVITRVLREDAFAAPVLDTALARYPEIDPRERALATEITYGSLRAAPYLLAEIGRHASRGIGTIDAEVRAHLIVAAYQILFLDRVPAFAAVSEAVRLIRQARGQKVGAFANAVLRRVSEGAAENRPDHLKRAIVESVAPWLRDALQNALGKAGATAFLSATAPPPLCVRIRIGQDRACVIDHLKGSAPSTASIDPGTASPLAILIRGGGDPHRLAGFERGEIVIQEEGAQVVALALGARAGETVLDACAGRGNKTSLIAEAVGPTGAVDAADVHEQKLDRLRTELAKMSLAPRATFAVDWTVGRGRAMEGYDRVLVDAPCSGIGTLRRRPELALRRESGDLAALSDLQLRILLATAPLVRPGGTLVYAVCSVLREEAEDVILRVIAQMPSVAPAPFPEGPVCALAGGQTSLRLVPHVHGTDGYFLACLRRAPS
jgi:16S rRNA (cytosine967-C5)-methyltransferase